MYSLKVTLWLINFNWEIQRFWVMWGQGKERPRVSLRILLKRQAGSTLVEALETSLEQPFPRSRFRWLRKRQRKIFSMILVRSLTLVVSAGSKQPPEKECQVLPSQLCKPGAATWFKKMFRRNPLPGSRSSTQCQLKAPRECGPENLSWGETRSWFSIETKTIDLPNIFSIFEQHLIYC